MKPNNKHWDPPFYERLEQKNKTRRPLLMKARGFRLYEIKRAADKNIKKHPLRGSSVFTTGGSRVGQISAFSSGGGYSVGVRVENVETRWMKPKQATLLRLQGATVREVPDDTPEGEYKNSYITGFEI